MGQATITSTSLSAAWRYTAAILAVAVAVVARLLLDPVLGDRVPFATFFLALIVVSWYSGSGPAALSLVLSALLAGYLFIPPRGALLGTMTPDWIGLVLFILVSTVIILLNRAIRCSKLQAEASHRQAVREREELRTTLMSLGDAVIVTDERARITTLNPVAQQLTGWSAEQALGQPLGQVFVIHNEATGERVESPVARVLKDGCIVGLANHTVLTAKDGSTSPIDDSAAPIRDEHGNLVGVVLVFRDITERRRAECRVQESESRFRNMADTSPAMIWMSGLDKRCDYFNKAWLDFTGRTVEQEWGDGWTDGIHPDDLDRCLRTYVTAFDARESFSMDYRLRCGDGQYRWVIDSGSPRYAPDGAFEGYIGSCMDIHDRVEAQAAVAEQKEWLRVTLASIGDGVIATDVQGRVTFLNPVAQSLTLWSQEQAGGRPLGEVFPIINETTRQAVENPVTKALREDRAVELANHTLLIDRDGHERPIEDSAAPIRDEHGNVRGVVLIFRDGSRHREIERRRAARLAVTQTLAEAATLEPAAVAILRALCSNLSWDVGTLWMINDDSQRLYPFTIYSRDSAAFSAFESACRNASFAQGETLPGRVWASRRAHWIADVTLDPAFSRGAAARQAGMHGGFACPVFLGQRVLGVIEFFSREIRDPDEDLLEMMTTLGGQLGQFMERVRAQQRLHEHLDQLVDAEQRLQFLANASRSLATLVDSAATMQRIANFAVPFFADWCAVHSPDEDGHLQQLAVAHMDPAKVQLAKDLGERFPLAPDAPAGSPRVFRTGESELVADIPVELLERIAHNEEHLDLLRRLGLKSYICVPIKLKDRVLGTISFVSAESARRYTPEDREVAEDLAHRAAIAMENERLYAELRDEHRRKDEFLAMLAHELRNPLAPISSGLEVMAMRGVEPQSVALMKAQTQHLVRLVDDLLDVSRIVRGRIQLRKERVDLTDVVRHAVQTVGPFINDQQQTLHLSLPQQSIAVDADPVRLAQVFINLLNNAAKYTPRGGRIWLTLQRSEKEARLSVRDDGIGIDRKLLPHVFDLFTQSDRSLERSQGGLGIGLTLARNLVEMHGGTVGARSAGEDQGSEFIVQLPVLPPESVSSSPLDRVPAPGQARRVLIVDDNVAGAKMLGLLLNKLGGHQVELVHDGDAAFAAAQSACPEIILLDIGLPGTNGFEVAQQLRKTPQFENTLIVALTGYGAEEDRRRALQAGFDLHVVKPPSLEQLQQIFQHPKLWPGGDTATRRGAAALAQPGERHNGDQTAG